MPMLTEEDEIILLEEEDCKILQENRTIVQSTRIPSAISLVCSLYIVYSVLSNYQKRSAPTQRIVLGMSMSDIIFSLFMFLAAWPMPRDTKGAFGAAGNTQTCTMQGFFLQFGGLMTPMYNGFLALYCFLYVCKDWSKQRMNKVELFGHGFVVIFALSCAIACLILELYNSMRNFCWLGPYPYNCTESYQSPDGTTDCIRGDNAHLYRVAGGMIIWFNVFWTCFAMMRVYCQIRQHEQKMNAYTNQYTATEQDTSSMRGSGTKQTPKRRTSNSDSRDVAVRGVLFTGAFWLTFAPITINELIELGGNENFPAHVLSTILFTSQGTLNFVVYILHPAVVAYFKNREQKQRARMDDYGGATTRATGTERVEDTPCENHHQSLPPPEDDTS